MSVSHAERVGAEVRGQLARQRKTQADLAEVLGLSQGAISRRLLGQVAFDVNELSRAALFLGVPVESLMGDSR